MATTTIDGRTIHFTDTGAGAPPLLLVHGFGGNLHHFDAQAPALATAHRVVAVDRSGHGESDTPAADLTVGLYADELAALCDDLGLYRAVVVQHSFDKVAIELAARRPDLVGGLVIIDGPTVPSAEFEAACHVLAGELEGDGWQDAVRAFAGRWVFPAAVPEEAREGVLATVWPVGQQVLASSWRGFVDHDARPVLRTLTCPVIYVAGAFPCDLDTLAADVAQLQTAEIRGRGHMLTFTAPDEVTALVAGFAAGLELAAVAGQ